MRSPARQDTAYVLHTRRYRENSLLVDALTLKQGRLTLVARAPTKARRSISEAVQPFREITLAFHGRDDLQTLERAEPLGPVPLLQGERLISGLYVNELVVRLTGRGEGDEALYRLYGRSVEALRGDGALEPLLRRFEVGLLEHCGYGVDFFATADTGVPISPEGEYFFVPDAGFMAESPGPGAQCLRGRTLLALGGTLEFDAVSLREAKRFMRQLLQRQLGDRPLNARALFGLPGD